MRTGPFLLGLGMALLAGCSFSVRAGNAIDKAEVEQQVATQVAARVGVGQQPRSVECPGDLDAEVGTTMRCQLLAPDGNTYGVTVKVTSVDGSRANFDFQVDDKPISG